VPSSGGYAGFGDCGGGSPDQHSETAVARQVLEVLENGRWRLQKIIIDGGYKQLLSERVAKLDRWRKESVEWVARNRNKKGSRLLRPKAGSWKAPLAGCQTSAACEGL
jgi:hypothetical protein